MGSISYTKFHLNDFGGSLLDSIGNYNHRFSKVVPIVYTYINTKFSENFYPYKIAKMMGEWLLNNKKISKEDIEVWLEDLRERDKEKEFYYSVNRNICLCTK